MGDPRLEPSTERVVDQIDESHSTDGDHEPTDPQPGPVTHSIVWATWALFVGLGLMLTGVGMFGTLIGVRAELEGFSPLAIGLVSAGYYGGFLVGSRVTLWLLGTVGHIRVYAALASLLAAAVVLAGLTSSPPAWIMLRFAAGACLAGQFVVAESWLNQIVSNRGRGRLLAIYSVTTVVAYGLGQLWFTQLDPTSATGFGIAAILISVAVSPVALSADAAPPSLTRPTHLTLRELWEIVPTGMVASFLVGITHGAFIGLSAVYATRLGLSLGQIGAFVAMPTLGSLLFGVVVSGASDRIDRRIVGAVAATIAAAAAYGLAAFGPDHWAGFVCMILIGGMTYPLYSIAGAYTNDWVPAERLTAAASQLVLLYGAGAFLGPIIGSFAMSAIGDTGYPWMAVATHLTIAVYLTIRIAQNPPSVRAKPWNAVPVGGRFLYLPPTAVAMGRRLRPGRRRSV